MFGDNKKNLQLIAITYWPLLEPKMFTVQCKFSKSVEVTNFGNELTNKSGKCYVNIFFGFIKKYTLMPQAISRYPLTSL